MSGPCSSPETISKAVPVTRPSQLSVTDLTCIRGGRTVFSGLTFSLKKGTGIELRGPNGAGKSSLLRVLAGFIPAATGEIALKGANEDRDFGEHCHYVGHLNGIKRAFTVRENLEFYATFLADEENPDGMDVDMALDAFDLTTLSDIPAALLSAGQSRRLGLARIALGHRPVWLLDEPSVSLDAASRKSLGRLIAAHMKNGGMVIASTHAPLGVKFGQTLTLGSKGRDA